MAVVTVTLTVPVPGRARCGDRGGRDDDNARRRGSAEGDRRARGEVRPGDRDGRAARGRPGVGRDRGHRRCPIGEEVRPRGHRGAVARRDRDVDRPGAGRTRRADRGGRVDSDARRRGCAEGDDHARGEVRPGDRDGRPARGRPGVGRDGAHPRDSAVEEKVAPRDRRGAVARRDRDVNRPRGASRALRGYRGRRDDGDARRCSPAEGHRCARGEVRPGDRDARAARGRPGVGRDGAHGRWRRAVEEKVAPRGHRGAVARRDRDVDRPGAGRTRRADRGGRVDDDPRRRGGGELHGRARGKVRPGDRDGRPARDRPGVGRDRAHRRCPVGEEVCPRGRRGLTADDDGHVDGAAPRRARCAAARRRSTAHARGGRGGEVDGRRTAGRREPGPGDCHARPTRGRSGVRQDGADGRWRSGTGGQNVYQCRSDKRDEQDRDESDAAPSPLVAAERALEHDLNTARHYPVTEVRCRRYLTPRRDRPRPVEGNE